MLRNTQSKSCQSQPGKAASHHVPRTQGEGCGSAPGPVPCWLSHREHLAARVVFGHLKRAVKGLPRICSCPSLGFTIRTWFLLGLRLQSRSSCCCLLMGSCYSLLPKSHLKPSHPGKRAEKEALSSRGFPSSAHTTSSCAWGWQSHLGNNTCALVSRTHLAPPDPWAEGLGFTSLEQLLWPLLSLLFKPFLEEP